ncbi:RIP metalloprotease RseP [Tabrizicola sp. YIM 78059]|uniref:RIP metalloprotease RseP n=1 Tax=Tabrizicola sp. YIM 78059 TaxID=2529861 RepID=UPI0010A9BF74|nr:RIP metalloprotease RseP [Tabrizicola sp. YIM 78059]
MEIFAALGGTAWTVFFFIVALSIIVFVHEYGHYIVGRWSGIHAEVFSIGFGPVLFSHRDRRGTRWQIAAIPFGGYVKFLGDADASSVRPVNMPGLSPAERRHTMAGAPLWARSATVAAGPVANFILTFVLLAGILMVAGLPREEPTVGELRALPFGGAELQTGDVILAIEGQPTPDLPSLGALAGVLPDKLTVTYTIRRGDRQMDVGGPHPFPAVVGQVIIRSAAMDAGLQAGDVILRAGGQEVTTFRQLPDIVAQSKGAPVPLTVWRNGQTFELTLVPRIRSVADETGAFVERYQIGIASGMAFVPATRSPGLIESMSLAVAQMWGMTVTTFSGLWHIITGAISSCNFSGAIGIAETMGDAARNGTESFVGMLAVLSLGIGIINLFPIPVLDGGHLVFHAYEAVMRRPPSERALRVLMTIGLTIVLSLMLFALSRDILCM